MWGHCEISLRYLATLEPGPLSLTNLARLRIRSALGPEGLARGEVDRLALPRSIKQFLNNEEVTAAAANGESTTDSGLRKWEDWQK